MTFSLKKISGIRTYISTNVFKCELRKRHLPSSPILFYFHKNRYHHEYDISFLFLLFHYNKKRKRKTSNFLTYIRVFLQLCHFVNVFITLPFAIFKNSCNSGFIFVFRYTMASSATILESHISL